MKIKIFPNQRNTVLALFGFAVSIFLMATFSHAKDAGGTQELAESSAVVWVDTRSWIENKIDSIEGDPRISYSDIVEGAKELGLQKNTSIRLYCAVGIRAGKAVKMLHAAGYSDVENAGGINDVRVIRFPQAVAAEN